MSQADSLEGQEPPRGHGDEPEEWVAHRFLRKVDESDIALSRGFLRCRPEKWFPGFSAHWLPLAHSLGIETRLTEVKPLRRAPRGLEVGFYGTIDGERVGIFFDSESSKNIIAGISPGSSKQANSIVLEYLVRRFLTSLMSSWSGADSSVAQFSSRAETMDFTEAGAIKLSIMINSSPVTIWILLGSTLVGRLDGLWRRQIISSARSADDESELRIELAATNISQSTVNELGKRGASVTFEGEVSDTVTLTLSGKPWLPARLCICGGNLALEMVATSFPQYPHSVSAVRATLEYNSVSLDAGLVSELSQIGAVFQTPLSAEDLPDLFIDGKRVSSVQLFVKNNRYLAKTK